MTGYSSHGMWVPSKEIYRVEKERGNPVDPLLLNEGFEAIWIGVSPRVAVRYLRTAEEDPNTPPTIEELQLLIKIESTNTIYVPSMNDGEGGQLWLRRIPE